MKKIGLIGLSFVLSLMLAACAKETTEVTTTQPQAVRPNLNQFRYDLADSIIEAQSAEVDTIAGATDSTTGWIQAVERALDEARSDEDTLVDGTYVKEGDHRQFGYEEATVVILDGEITSVTLKRLNPDGTEVDYSQWTGQ